MNRDEQIVNWLKSGDMNRAAEALYLLFDGVHGILRQKGANTEDIKDLFQEAVLVLMRKIAEENETINCTLKTYLTTICKYQWNNKVNKLSHKKTDSIEFFNAEIVNDQKDFEQEEHQYNILKQVIGQIGEKCKMLLTLFYLEQKKMTEIAEMMGFSGINSAKTQKYKCIEKARKMASESTITLKSYEL